MGLLVVKHSGNFNNMNRFLKNTSKTDFRSRLERYGREGVNALASATPKRSGVTAASWGYRTTINKRGVSLEFTNSHINKGVPIAILIQYGHATRQGGYVQGRDYINPAIQPIFDRIAEDIWREVSR